MPQFGDFCAARTMRTAVACGLVAGAFAGAAAFGQETPPWTPAPLIDSSPLFQPASLLQPADESGQTPMPPESAGAENTNSLLEQFSATTQLPARETIPGFEAPVTSLTLSPSTVGKSPAAIFVIDQEMIRRSGAQTLPEVLRMVPGVHVGVGNGLVPIVSIRGFGTDGGNPRSSRIQVLIDGRSLYDPVVGGILWNANDVVLQDVERIEIIRGPGATVWGANAVNGVVNIITKSAADTQGTLLSSLGGTELHNITVARRGVQVGDDAYLRVYGKFRDIGHQLRDPADAAASTAFAGEPANDGFHEFQGGFRFDKEFESSDTWSIQGRISSVPPSSAATFALAPNIFSTPAPAGHFVGSVQSEFTHVFDDTSSLTFLAIYDRADLEGSAGAYSRDSYILDLAYRWNWGTRHRLLAGAQIRFDRDNFRTLRYPDATLLLDPASQIRNIPNWLLQDEIELIPDELSFIAGTKMEVNPYTGFEIQPSGRLLKTIDPNRVVWGAVSRAIRRPQRLEEHFVAFGPTVPIANFDPFRFETNGDLKSSELTALEIGYRSSAIDFVSWDASAFYNIYENLLRYPMDSSDPTITVFRPDDGISAQSYGVEFNATVELTDHWSVTGNYSVLSVFAQSEALPTDVDPGPAESRYEGSTPRNIAYVRNSWSPTRCFDVDWITSYCDRVNLGGIPAYVEMDLRVAWRPRERLELAVVGQNLLDAAHPEFGTVEVVSFNPIRTQVQRGVYGSVTYEY